MNFVLKAWASLIAQLVKNTLANDAGGKEPVYQCWRLKLGFDPWVGKIPWKRVGSPLQYSCLENPVVRSLADYSPWGHKESDTTEATEHKSR